LNNLSVSGDKAMAVAITQEQSAENSGNDPHECVPLVKITPDG
jgi:hypothetical protein